MKVFTGNKTYYKNGVIFVAPNWKTHTYEKLSKAQIEFLREKGHPEFGEDESASIEDAKVDPNKSTIDAEKGAPATDTDAKTDDNESATTIKALIRELTAQKYKDLQSKAKKLGKKDVGCLKVELVEWLAEELTD